MKYITSFKVSKETNRGNSYCFHEALIDSIGALIHQALAGMNPDYAPKYENEGFTKNMEQEIHFLVEEMNLSKGSRILDVGCGTGRHSVALAKKGMRRKS